MCMHIHICIYVFLGKYPRQVWSLKHHYMFIEYESLCSSQWLINQKNLLIFFPWLTDNKISKMARRKSYKILCILFLDIDPFYKEKANILPFFPWWVKYFWGTHKQMHRTFLSQKNVKMARIYSIKLALPPKKKEIYSVPYKLSRQGSCIYYKSHAQR